LYSRTNEKNQYLAKDPWKCSELTGKFKIYKKSIDKLQYQYFKEKDKERLDGKLKKVNNILKDVYSNPKSSKRKEKMKK